MNFVCILNIIFLPRCICRSYTTRTIHRIRIMSYNNHGLLRRRKSLKLSPHWVVMCAVNYMAMSRERQMSIHGCFNVGPTLKQQWLNVSLCFIVHFSSVCSTCSGPLKLQRPQRCLFALLLCNIWCIIMSTAYYYCITVANVLSWSSTFTLCQTIYLPRLNLFFWEKLKATLWTLVSKIYIVNKKYFLTDRLRSYLFFFSSPFNFN